MPTQAMARHAQDPEEISRNQKGRNVKTGFDLEKMRAGLQAAGLDAGVVTSLPNVRYCTGIEIQTHACLPLRLQMLVIPVSGSPLLLGC